MQFIPKDEKVYIGTLQITAPKDLAEYGTNIVEYFDRLKALEGQMMLYGQLDKQYIQNIAYPPVRLHQEGWAIGGRISAPPRNLIFVAMLRHKPSIRIPEGIVINHEKNHEIARLPLDELVLQKA